MRNGILLIAAILILAGCGGKKNAPTPITPPAKAILTAPSQNAVCVTGAIISDSQSSVSFSWNAADNTESYDVVFKNLLTSATTTQNTTATQLTVTLLRNTPYSWHVVSKSSKISTTAQSDTWKFYNAGPGIISYAPFPAEIKTPAFGEIVTTATVNLTWKGSAVDNSTIASYDVYFGTAASPALLKGAISDAFVNNVSITSKTTYYWKVITRDTNGNTSDSGVYQFSTK